MFLHNGQNRFERIQNAHGGDRPVFGSFFRAQELRKDIGLKWKNVFHVDLRRIGSSYQLLRYLHSDGDHFVHERLDQSVHYCRQIVNFRSRHQLEHFQNHRLNMRSKKLLRWK